MMNTQQSSDLEQVVEDYLLDRYDLMEIMADLKGEELDLEELALTLIAGGIELEYLSEKYKTSKGDYSLLMVIACQDSLEVDWEDHERRIGRVLRAQAFEEVCATPPDLQPSLSGRPMSEMLRPCGAPHWDSSEMGESDSSRYEKRVDLVEEAYFINKTGRLLFGGVSPGWSQTLPGLVPITGPSAIVPKDGAPPVRSTVRARILQPSRLKVWEIMDPRRYGEHDKVPNGPLGTHRKLHGGTSGCTMSGFSKHRLDKVLREANQTSQPFSVSRDNDGWVLLNGEGLGY